MKTFQLGIVSSFAAALAISAGCGGNVVVDGGSGGGGGAKTSSNTSNATSGTTSSGPTANTGVGTTGTFMSGVSTVATSVGTGGACSGQTCVANSDGSCGCEIVCNNQVFSSRCQVIPGGAICECAIDQVPIAKCEDPVAVCEVFGSCCGPFFANGGG